METPASPPPTLLQLNQCTIRFGGLTAVSELNLQLGANELIGLIGPNGAGKTTVFNLITGVYQPSAGEILFAGDTLIGKTGRSLASMKTMGKGVVHVEHETWSAVAEEDIARGEPIIVTSVDSDNVTLKVRKYRP